MAKDTSGTNVRSLNVQLPAVFAIGIAMMANAAAPVLGVHGVQDAKGQLVVDQVFSGTGERRRTFAQGT